MSRRKETRLTTIAKQTWGIALPFFRQKTAPLSAADLQSRYLTAVFAYISARVGNTAEAEDITADAFAAAFAALDRCPRPSDGATNGDDPARAWVFGIARRKLADCFRRRSRRPTAPMEDEAAYPAPPSASPEALALASEAAHELGAILDQLPERQREVLLLKYRDDLSLAEIARITQTTPGAVGQLLHRARTNARARGKDYFGSPADEEIPR